jgi:ATP-dependent Zn protease
MAALLEKETIEGEELQRLMEQVTGAQAALPNPASPA